jgi:hypothetical protein
MQTYHFFRDHPTLTEWRMHVTPIARTSGGGDIDLVYGENSLRHAKNKNTFRTHANLAKHVIVESLRSSRVNYSVRHVS